VPGGRWVMNLALFTYFIPAAFLAVPMYKAMGTYGLLNNRWSLVLAMVTLASPYAIWVLKQASDKLPVELDEAATMDGATTLQLKLTTRFGTREAKEQTVTLRLKGRSEVVTVGEFEVM